MTNEKKDNVQSPNTLLLLSYRYSLHIESEEGKKQISNNLEEKRKQTLRSSTFASAAAMYHTLSLFFLSFSLLFYMMIQRYGGGEYDDEAGVVLRNPFNFSDRAVQTITRPARVYDIFNFLQ